ncbi:flagellar basal body L-ring protein FlgH [Aestuariibacter sp. AA17]|uniref:Flagellar L-ring protein n=1 Tax=Fluctibacter corallii TaxID=2984329 RepID=A0ABT3AA67_9ALTE|nr:flagellar basal body L-ring protein FlgH [Aestuariibacter sp. AA17]MCV2885482.1 flagellar basal body L-ring protein FlgH [Aestuariibacter sp. AA17]
MKIIGLISLIVLLAGCQATDRVSPLPNDPFYAPVMPEEAMHKVAEDGSIFQASNASSLYSDVKARRVGDIISVTLQENTSANKSAGTNTSRDNAINYDPIIGLGGNPLRIGSESIQLGITSSDSFEGDASANQSNSLSGSISVTVVRVLPNQNLMVRGEKWLTLNNGDEYIRLTGIVRPADISPDNEIVSNKVANARIQYSGTGTFANAQKQGWLTKFFQSEWWPL